MRIALIQTNPLVGDFERNAAMLLDRVEAARRAGCELAILPELALCGYPPQDLLERPTFVEAHDRALEGLISRIQGIGVILGALERRGGAGRALYNSALLVDRGRVIHRVRKRLLPTYDVFDERRYFEPGEPSLPMDYHGLRLGLSVCEDLWAEAQPLYGIDPVAELVAAAPGGLDCIVNVSASPFHAGKIIEREALLGRVCRRAGVPLVYVNQVGGQDSLLFDGFSMVLDREGRVCARAAGFREDLLIVDSETWGNQDAAPPPPARIDNVLEALCMGLRDYFGKLGFRSALLGISGGIDSALTCAIACRALGPDKVLGVALPSAYTSQASIDDARALAANLGCRFALLPIIPMVAAAREGLAPFFSGLAEDVTEQNLQARVRGLLLMALSNKFGQILLATGNKSELAVGYCTLYGDMNGGLAVIGDVPKQMVYALARHINRDHERIPLRSIERPPTAELKPDQCDQDDLPPYERLDAILQLYLEENRSIAEIVAAGHDEAEVRDVVRRIKVNEYKRKQAPLVLKVTTKAFGCGRRYPTVQNFAG